jgi:2'-5' RNA ligase
MTKERLKSPRARLFVALDLPDAVRDGLSAWQRDGLGDEALRPVRTEALHVTLCFLAYQPEREIERIGSLVLGLRPRPVELRFRPDPVAVPRGRPRLYAAAAESAAAEEVAAEVCGRLEEARLYKPEKRPFWPHVTVARVRPKKGRRNKPRRIQVPPGALPEALLEPFRAVRVTLYRSFLRPSGAEYVPLAGLDLPPHEAGKR